MQIIRNNNHLKVEDKNQYIYDENDDDIFDSKVNFSNPFKVRKKKRIIFFDSLRSYYTIEKQKASLR